MSEPQCVVHVAREGFLSHTRLIGPFPNNTKALAYGTRKFPSRVWWVEPLEEPETETD